MSDSQYKPTLHKKLANDMIPDYSHTYLNEKIRYHTSEMILYVKSNTDY